MNIIPVVQPMTTVNLWNYTVVRIKYAYYAMWHGFINKNGIAEKMTLIVLKSDIQTDTRLGAKCGFYLNGKIVIWEQWKWSILGELEQLPGRVRYEIGWCKKNWMQSR